MKVMSFYPVVATTKENVAQARDFYVRHLGFEVTFDSDWYVSLKLAGERPFELAILQHDHPTMPATHQRSAQGILLNFEVEDADAAYQRLVKEAGLPLVRDIKSEDFGQRHFVLRDPANVLVDVIQVIPPSGEFTENYKA